MSGMKPPDAYELAYSRWLRDPEGFWAEAAQAVHWNREWTAVLDRSRPPFHRWFPGARINMCYCAVDRHADGPRGTQPALIYDMHCAGSQAYLKLAREVVGRERARREAA